LMKSDEVSKEPKWYDKHRWAISAAIVGMLMVSIVIATGGEHGAWTLWIAIPLLMFSLGYLFLVNAIPVFINLFSDDNSEQEQK